MAKKKLAKKYGASSTKKMKENVEKEDSMIDSGNGGNDWIEIKTSGTYKIRIMPTEGDEPYSILRRQHWLEFESDNEEGKTYKSTVLNAKVHGNQKSDVVESYMNMAKEFIEASTWPTKDQKTALDALLGQSGLKGSNSWIAYALQLTKEDPKFGLIELKKVVRDRLNEEAIYDDEEDGIDIDPFTCPEDGKYIVLTYNKDAKHWTKYWKVKIGKKRPLSEEDLEHLEDAKPLNDLFYYELSDFEKAIKGLQFFDEKNEIGLFEEDEWNEVVDKLREALEESLEGKKSKSKAKAEETDDDEDEFDIEDEVDEDDDEDIDLEDEDEDDEFTDMDRKALIKWAAKKLKAKEASKSDFPIKKSTSADDIRELCRAWVSDQEEEIDDEDDEDDEDDDLAAIKAKLAAMNDEVDKVPF